MSSETEPVLGIIFPIEPQHAEGLFNSSADRTVVGRLQDDGEEE